MTKTNKQEKISSPQTLKLTSQNDNVRSNPRLIIVLGYTNTGKSTFIRQLINRYVLSRPRVLIVTPHDCEFTDIAAVDTTERNWRLFSGIRRIVADDKILETVSGIKPYQNGLLVFDDCRCYLDSATDKELHKLFISRKQRGLDIIAAGHGFTEVPPKFFTFASDIVLFKTNDNILRRKNVLRNFEECAEVQKRVNAAKDFHSFEIIKLL